MLTQLLAWLERGSVLFRPCEWPRALWAWCTRQDRYDYAPPDWVEKNTRPYRVDGINRSWRHGEQRRCW